MDQLVLAHQIQTREYQFSNQDLLKLFFPLVVEQLLEYLVGLADSVMVASIGEAAVSGVSLVDFIMALLISLFAALATGGTVIAGQYLGKGDSEKARSTANQLLRFVVLVSVGIMLLVYLFKDFILDSLFGQISPEVRNHANIYLTITALSIPCLGVYGAVAAIFRTMSNSKLPMQVSLFMGLLNVMGNFIALYILHIGTAGVAFSTLIARLLGALIILFIACKPDLVLRINKQIRVNFQWFTIKQIMSIGIPYGLENTLFYLGRIIILSLVASFGTASIAANAVGGTIVMFQVLPGMAVGLGLTVVIARCVGAGDFEQAKYYTKKIVIIVYLAHLLINIIILALLPYILQIYGLSENATKMTSEIVLWHGALSILIWPLAYTLPVTFRASGDAKYPMYVGICSMFVCRVALAYVLGVYLGMGLIGTWFAMFFDWLIKAVLYLWHYYSQKWTKFRTI